MRKIVGYHLGESALEHRRALIDGEITFSDSSERVHDMKIVIKMKDGREERDVGPFRNTILDLHLAGQMGGSEN